jgi:Protein of unknown function (DUF2505)
MKFEHSNSYEAPASDVYAMLTDRDFREKVCSYIRAPKYDVTIDESSGVTTVRIDQQQRVRKVPAFAAKLVGETVQVVQVERWTSPTTADLELTIPGKPGHLNGRITLEEASGRTVERITGELKVSIPLVGGKLEGVIEGLIKLGISSEEEIGRQWLAGER